MHNSEYHDYLCLFAYFLFIGWWLNKYLKGYEENKTGTIGRFKMYV